MGEVPDNRCNDNNKRVFFVKKTRSGIRGHRFVQISGTGSDPFTQIQGPELTRLHKLGDEKWPVCAWKGSEDRGREDLVIFSSEVLRTGRKSLGGATKLWIFTKFGNALNLSVFNAFFFENLRVKNRGSQGTGGAPFVWPMLVSALRRRVNRILWSAYFFRPTAD